MSSRQLNDLKNKKFNSINNSYDDNLKVYIRVRPPLMREKDSSLPFRSIATVSEDKSTISLRINRFSKSFPTPSLYF